MTYDQPNRSWCFTSFRNELVFGDLVSGYAYQREECPESKRLHFQGYVEFSRPVRLKQCKQQIGDESAHVDVRRGTRLQAIEYSTKKDTRVAGPWVSGSCESKQGQGRRSDMEPACEVAKLRGAQGVAEEFPALFVKYHRGFNALAQQLLPSVPQWRNVHTTVLFGQTGTGKTRWAYEHDGALYKLMKPNKGGVLWFDGYSNQKTLLVDDYRGWIPFSTLLHILDGYPLQLQTKGGTIQARWDHVIITANSPPEDWHKYADQESLRALLRRLTCVVTL